MKALLAAALLCSLCLASPAQGQDLSGLWFSNDNDAELLIHALPPGFNNDYVVSFYTSMDTAPGICLGEGLAALNPDTGEMLLVLDDDVSLPILVQHSDAGLILRIDHDPGPYCGMGASMIGIFELAPQ